MGPQSPTAHSQSALRNAQMASGGAVGFDEVHGVGRGFTGRFEPLVHILSMVSASEPNDHAISAQLDILRSSA